MTKRLQISLPEGWSDYSQDNGGAPTYLRDASEDPGPLQISWAEYKGGAVPNPSAEDLAQMSRELGSANRQGALVESSSGLCKFGCMGTAVFQSAERRVQFWHLSDGRDFIMVTHMGPESPNPDELREVQEIVRNLTLGEGKPKWQFWR